MEVDEAVLFNFVLAGILRGGGDNWWRARRAASRLAEVAAERLRQDDHDHLVRVYSPEEALKLWPVVSQGGK